MWSQLEPTGPHLTYIILSSFLIVYAIFSLVIRNRLHLSEPPLATLFGIIFGPRGLGFVHPIKWSVDDVTILEYTRVILGIQVFAVGIELPKFYFSGHWKSVAVFLGPVMTWGWLICALLIWGIFRIDFPTSLVISSCLTPTDPVLAASVLSNSQFSTRVPARIKNVLSAESACNDGVSFPFLYFGLALVLKKSVGGFFQKWFLITCIYQCLLGTVAGLAIGQSANWILKYAHAKDMISRGSYLVFYLLMAVFSIGIASTLGLDDFLVAFGAGVGFARDGWFSEQIAETNLLSIIDLLLSSSLFVFFGAILPWEEMNKIPQLSAARVVGFIILVLLIRRIPIVLLVKKITPDIYTYREALFCGHFGPMGVGALFLSIEARSQLESGESIPQPHPPTGLPPIRQRGVDLVWPLVCCVVLASTMIHGLSTLAISLGGHFSRPSSERAPLLGGETAGFGGMVHDGDDEHAFEDDE